MSNLSTDTKMWRDKMKSLGIIVIIPTYNNDKTLLSVVEEVKMYSCDIMVVNDGSTDETSKILGNISDIQIITLEKNRGKGFALKTGLLAAKEQGYRYAITIDSDGQHYPDDIPVFVEAIDQNPDILLIGARNLTADNMPGKNTFANKFSNFWYWVETGKKLEDTQSGYRLYPLHKIGSMRYCTTKYEFELAIAVFTAWRGIKVTNIPVKVYYPPEGERVSHFRPLRDFTRISILNTFLVLINFLWILPLKFFRNLTWANIQNFVKKEVLGSKDSNKKITLSIMLGIFMGIVPIWGYQMIVAAFLAHVFKLNKVITLVASNISIPPCMPFLLYASYATGCYVTGNPMALDFTDISLKNIETVLFQSLIGSIIFATIMSLALGLISGVLLMLFRKNKQPADI